MFEKLSLSGKTLTHIVNSPWNDDICVLLGLGENKVTVLKGGLLTELHWKIGDYQSSYLQASKIPQKQA